MVNKLADTEVGGGQNLKTKLCLNRSKIYIFLSKDSNSRLSAQKTKTLFYAKIEKKLQDLPEQPAT